MNSKVDLHMHTVISDGTDTIPELLKKIQTLGITTFAVTDHDAIDGALEMERIVPAEIKFIKALSFRAKQMLPSVIFLVITMIPIMQCFENLLKKRMMCG